MRQPARQLADGLHLLRLPQRLLRALERLGLLALLGDVAPAAIDHAAVRNAHPRDPAAAAVLAAVAVREADRRLALLRQVEAAARALDVVRVQQLEDRHARHFGFGPSEHRHPRWVGRDEIPLGVQRAEQVGTDLPGRAAFLRALGDLALEFDVQVVQPLFRPLAIRDVEADAGKPQRRAVGGHLAAALGQHPACAAVGVHEPVLLAEQLAGGQHPRDALLHASGVSGWMPAKNSAIGAPSRARSGVTPYRRAKRSSATTRSLTTSQSQVPMPRPADSANCSRSSLSARRRPSTDAASGRLTLSGCMRRL